MDRRRVDGLVWSQEGAPSLLEERYGAVLREILVQDRRDDVCDFTTAYVDGKR
jgi:hypothetical protein